MLATGEMYVAKSSGPSTLPCGMPVRQLTDTDRALLTPTYCERLLRNDCRHLSAIPVMPKSPVIRSIRMPWSIVSKAADVSNNVSFTFPVKV